MNSFRSLRTAVFAGVLAVVWTNPVISEESDTDADIEEVIVTGSRIARSNTETTAPIKIIDRYEIEKLGQTSIGDFLQDLPENVGGLNAQNNNGGNGSTQISLRGLGSSRTLVLINGRRHVPYSTGGSVDLNAIAPNTIERIEVLNDGASTIYGSDAIAGVVNVITRRDFEGVTLGGYSGVSAESDGQITDINLTMGSSSDRGNVTVAIGHYEMNDVMAGNRGWANQDRWYDWDLNDGTFEGLGSSATPEGTIIDRLGAEGNEAWTAIADPTYPYFWGPGGNNPSTIWSPFQFSGNSDVGEGSYYNYQPENYIYTPQERTNVFATGHYEIRDALTAVVELSYINRKSDQLLAPTPLFIISEGLTIEAAQAHNPFGRDFIDVRRRMVEAGNRNFLQDIDTYRLVGSLEYEIEGWSLEASINYGRTDGTDTNEGRFIRSRVLEALSGTCTDPCVPLNLFGGPGTISQDQIDYISYVGTAKTTQEQKTVQVNVSNNNIYELPAGNLGLAMGWEHRNERGTYVEDPLTEMGDTTGNKGESTRGSYEVDEAYIEFLAPIFDTDQLGVLDLEYSVRASDYSNFGRSSNSKYGFRWDFRDWIPFRTTVSEAFNAPSIASLFSGQFDSSPAAVDPCSTVVGQYGTNANVTANCDADGFVGGTTDPDTQLRARLGGN
ncbi:MAG TPA: TonB-dependent receptor, partial [Pseudomonadales bacterium]|nr:TonB-dependent receptor [Pseudomonadales bacterium]